MRLTHALLIAALLPASVYAQGMGGMGGMGGGMRGGRGGGGGQMGGQRRGGGMPKFATAKELEKFNAADALLNDQRKLKLTPEQIEKMTALRATLYEKNSDLLVRYDSVRREFKPPTSLTDPRGPADENSMPSQEEMAKLREQMLLMMSIGEQMMERRPDDVASCLALVDDSQKDRATNVLKDQTEEMRKAIPERPTRDGRGMRR
jgi:hypothetical protein